MEGGREGNGREGGGKMGTVSLIEKMNESGVINCCVLVEEKRREETEEIGKGKDKSTVRKKKIVLHW